MEKNNPIYKAGELLKNDSFIRWQLFNSTEDGLFWKEYLNKNPEGLPELEKAIQIFHSIRVNRYKLTPGESADLFEAVQDRIHRDKRRNRYIYLAASAAAIFLLLFSFSDQLFHPFRSGQEKEILLSQIEATPKGNEILMILGDDQVMVFDEETEFRQDEQGNLIVLDENQKVIQQKTSQKEGVSFNKLIVPKGKRSYLTLADETRLWINSGSIVEFPPAFTGDKREIKVEGEVYLEVTEDKQKPFIVTTPEYTVTVLGTSFNISAYQEEESNFVVLVDGLVEVNTPAKAIKIQPEQMATVRGEDIRIDRVEVSSYISWKDGLLEFQSQPLSYILNRLTRYYDIPVICDEAIRDMKCTGKLVLFDQIEEVMETLGSILPVRYTINNHDIYIKKREN